MFGSLPWPMTEVLIWGWGGIRVTSYVGLGSDCLKISWDIVQCEVSFTIFTLVLLWQCRMIEKCYHWAHIKWSCPLSQYGILWAKVLRSLRTDLVKEKERHLGFNIRVATRCHWSTLSLKARYKIFELLLAEQEYLVMNGC